MPIEWTRMTEENITLVELFILVDRIHQWIAANEAYTGMNYLSLVCTSGIRSDERWAASFDSFAYEAEWYESIEDYRFSAKGACLEDAIFRAALKVKNEIEKIEAKEVSGV